MTFADLHLTETLAAALDALGWEAGDPFVRAAVPPAARGQNLVAVRPPGPAYAAPILAGLLARRSGGGGPVMALAPPASLTEWTAVVAGLAAAGSVRALLSPGPGTAARQVRGGSWDLCILAPASALELRRRSLLPLEALGAILLVEPERWDDPDALTELMQDLPHPAQRAILTPSPAACAPILERYAWRAMVVGEPAAPPTPIGPVSTVSVPWGRRVAVLAELAEALQPESLAVWTADRSRHPEIARALAGLGVPVEVTHRDPGPAAAVVAFDLPSPERLAALLPLGRLVVLTPPGTEGYLASLAAPCLRLPLPGELAGSGRTVRQRARIEQILSAVDLDRGLLALAPLFERHPPAAVAAALYHLWTEGEGKGERPPPPSPPPATPAAERARIWIGVGRKDGAGPNDLVGVLLNEVRLDRTAIGRVDVRETYSLVEVPAADAERVARAMAGRTIRGRRVTARLDDRPSSRPERPSRPRGSGRPGRR